MYKVIAFALLQFAALNSATSSVGSKSNISMPASTNSMADSGSGGWGGGFTLADSGSGGWGGGFQLVA